ncbi:MAG: putative integral rane protein [Geminicoccaceae bacterium]|nr:putative integral rane protein [Geminicoccaceae bacterium]
MPTAYVIVNILAAVTYAYAAYVDFSRAEWVLDNMTKYGVPHSWLFVLGALKAAGAIGLLVGIRVPQIGGAAAIGLILYFVGAIVTVVRAHWYSHLHFPVLFLLPAAGSLVVLLAST